MPKQTQTISAKKTAPRANSSELDELFKIAVNNKASDLHLVVGQPPLIRIDGRLNMVKNQDIMTNEKLEELLFSITSEQQKNNLVKKRDLDMSYEITDVARFRINMHYEKGNLGLVARVVTHHIPDMKEIVMPEASYNLARLRDGLILVTGPTGSGKSTTLAAMINMINTERNAHIVTLEDPIEFIFDPTDSIIKQRELGSDVLSFASGLKHTLRQDPDVIMVGEMRDLETIAATMTLAETGHLVLATLHTINAAQTIDRIID
ncbi:MAG: PilT/PilU family type 4a pilus ATPase, partial [Patescibacteria group bacterium]|nr:PilT/PilU family type 4a pilus ATPase [Patescibacteria group bacterium]